MLSIILLQVGKVCWNFCSISLQALAVRSWLKFVLGWEIIRPYGVLCLHRTGSQEIDKSWILNSYFSVGLFWPLQYLQLLVRLARFDAFVFVWLFVVCTWSWPVSLRLTTGPELCKYNKISWFFSSLCRLLIWWWMYTWKIIERLSLQWRTKLYFKLNDDCHCLKQNSKFCVDRYKLSKCCQHIKPLFVWV